MTTAAVPTSPAFRQALPGPVLAAAVVFLLVYGVELSGFTLSIDEEIASFSPATAAAWLSQGRWGMGVLTWVLPNFEAIPLLSTVLFGAGLLFATARGLQDFRLDGMRAYAYAIVHAGFPLWLHIAEFNTFAAGFGIGVAAAAAGAGLAVGARSAMHRVLAVALLAFAISVYQTLALYAVLYAIFALHAGFDDEARDDAPPTLVALLRHSMPVAALFLVALVAYWLVQRGAMRFAGVEAAYVDVYWQTDRLKADPSGTLRDSFRAFAEYLTGRQQMYLGWGSAILFPIWLGLLPTMLFAAAASSRRLAYRLGLAWLVVLAGAAVVSVPFVLSAGTLPIRAHIAWPLLAAWLASRTMIPEGPRWRMLYGASLAYFAIVACSIGATLFHAERLVRAHDAALAQQLVPEMRRAAGTEVKGRIPFTIVGQSRFPTEGQIQRAGVFGTSFYEHDGGNVYRVALYMKTLGIHDFDAVVLGHRPELVPDARAMPVWPAPGSVRLVGGVVIVKLGEPTPPQLPQG
jgi:hypothetical protein